MSAAVDAPYVSHPGAGRPDPMQPGFVITVFKNYAATTNHEETHSFTSMADAIRTAGASSKGNLPWLKLARFGDLRSEKNSLRHDANVLVITGVEGDYDDEKVTFGDAVELARKADLSCIIYTSPSHTEDTPRWRVLCPTSEELPPARRDRLMGRLNGVFGGIFSGESWTLSQSYYYGSVRQNPSHCVEVIEGTPIDLLHDLDETWIGKADTGPPRVDAVTGERRSGPVDEDALLQQLVAGENYHQSAVRLLGKWARDGIAYMDARARLVAAMELIPQAQRDVRWRARFDDIDRCLDDIYVKEATARDRGERRPKAPGGGLNAGDETESWPDPIDFLGDHDLTGVPELRREHLPDALRGFVFDAAEGMGVDPSAVAIAALTAASGAMHEDCRLQPKQHDDTWTESPRLWAAIVGDPSILKTPVIAACTRPIERLDAEARRRHQQEMEVYLPAEAAWKKSDCDPAAKPRLPLLDRYLVEGTTVEALSNVLRDDADAKMRAPLGKVLVRQDELTEWLGSFDRYKSGGRGGGDRGAYLRLYNGGRYLVDRVGRGNFAVPSWSASIIGGIQPGPIRRIAHEAEDDGLLQRFIYCMPARQEGGIDRAPDYAAIARYEALFPILVTMRPEGVGTADGESGLTVPRALKLASDAHQHRQAVTDLASAVSALPDTSTRLKAAFGKWPGLFARLALVFHLIEQADAVARQANAPPAMEVSAATAGRVASYMRDILLPHLLRVEAVMFATTQTGHARWIAGHILARATTRLSLRDVVQAYGALRAPENRRELLDVMEGLTTMGWLRPEPQANPARPPSAWQVNPAVHQIFAVRAEQERRARTAAQVQIGELHRQIRRKP